MTENYEQKFINQYGTTANLFNDSSSPVLGTEQQTTYQTTTQFEGFAVDQPVDVPVYETVQITADFITTGEIKLIMDLEPPLRILQEDSSSLQSEQDADADLATQQQ